MIGIKYIVVSISTGKIVSKHYTLAVAREQRRLLRPEGGAELMYSIYKYIE